MSWVDREVGDEPIVPPRDCHCGHQADRHQAEHEQTHDGRDVTYRSFCEHRACGCLAYKPKLDVTKAPVVLQTFVCALCEWPVLGEPVRANERTYCTPEHAEMDAQLLEENVDEDELDVLDEHVEDPEAVIPDPVADVDDRPEQSRSTAEQVDELIEYWHDRYQGPLQLHEFLCLTWVQFTRFMGPNAELPAHYRPPLERVR